MPYLIAAVILLAVLGMLNLLLTLAIVRRMRTTNPVQLPPEPLSQGTPIRPFTATTIDGRTVSEYDLRGGQALVGYFSPGCPPCEAALPRFVSYAAGLDRDRVLAVIVGDAGDEAVALDAVAQVVLASEHAPVVDALSAYGYPAVFLLDEDGRVVAADTTVDGLPMVTAR